jgi:hypothetical protein
LFAIVLVSGCIGQEFFNIPGGGVIQPSRPVVDQGVTNLVTVEDVRTLPVGQVLPDTTLRLFLSLVNHDNDPTRTVQSVKVDLFDAGVFRSPQEPKPFCNAGPNNCPPSICRTDDPVPCTMRAGETKAIEFNLLAPTREQIANILTQTSLNFRASYDFTGSTNYDILVVNAAELLRLQQEGKTLSVSVQDTKGAGPMKIDVSLFTPYVATSAERPEQSGDAFVVFKLRNAGTGFVKDNRITAMTIDFPKELFSAGGFFEGDFDKRFACQPAEVGGLQVVRCTYSLADTLTRQQSDSSIRPIELFKKESDPMQFIIKRVAPISVPHKAFTINARIDYTYELRGATTVTVSPPQR